MSSSWTCGCIVSNGVMVRCPAHKCSNDYHASVGAEQERAAIVAWLRSTEEASESLHALADAIERGEHKK